MKNIFTKIKESFNKCLTLCFLDLQTPDKDFIKCACSSGELSLLYVSNGIDCNNGLGSKVI